jgi:hypothetical protein
MTKKKNSISTCHDENFSTKPTRKMSKYINDWMLNIVYEMYWALDDGIIYLYSAKWWIKTGVEIKLFNTLLL